MQVPEVSSAKVQMVDFSATKKMSLIKWLKIKGPNGKHCGTLQVKWTQ